MHTSVCWAVFFFTIFQWSLFVYLPFIMSTYRTFFDLLILRIQGLNYNLLSSAPLYVVFSIYLLLYLCLSSKYSRLLVFQFVMEVMSVCLTIVVFHVRNCTTVWMKVHSVTCEVLTVVKMSLVVFLVHANIKNSSHYIEIGICHL